jgi:hypothetical protein
MQIETGTERVEMFELLLGRKREVPAETSTAVAVAQPGDGIAARKAELLAQIRELDIALGDCDAAQRAFRLKNMATVNGRLALVYPAGTDTGEARRSIESGWKNLCLERDAIQKRRNEILQELARLS